MSSKRYDRQAVSEILRRAAELERGSGAGGGAGLTREDIERVATESGLDPAAVRRAIAERERGGADRAPGGLLGGPYELRFERIVDAELDDEGVEQVLELAMHELGMHGRWYRNGDSWTWKPKGVQRNLELRVLTRPGRTEIRLEEKLGPLAGGLWGGLMGGLTGASVGLSVAVGLAAFGSGAAVAGLLLASLGGSFFLTRSIYGSAARKQGRKLARLMDRLEAEARAELEAMAVQETESGRAPVTEAAEPPRTWRRDRDDDDERRRRGRRRRSRN